MSAFLLVSLRPACARVLPSAAPIFASASHRNFSFALSRANSLKVPSISEPAQKGAEGLHRNDSMPVPSSSTSLPAIHGDWVLFHPVYGTGEVDAVKVIHRKPKTFQDRIARSIVTLSRRSFDLVTGYREKPIPVGSTMSAQELQRKGYVLSEAQWMRRILFLESIAGVPGMVAAAIRHLQSLRLMRRDSGWIHTLLEEAENERMHLMTFMTVRQPSVLFRTFVLGAQGVFYNLFFFSYILAPNACHRFVGYLEEEAVHTYTNCIRQIEAGHLPEWESRPAPGIAIDYWRLPKDATMRDVVYAVRSDETTHRFVNHSLANLDTKTDVNPFALREPNMFVKGAKIEFDRSESEKYVAESRQLLQDNRSPSA